jgi:hypothetical protein
MTEQVTPIVVVDPALAAIAALAAEKGGKLDSGIPKVPASTANVKPPKGDLDETHSDVEETPAAKKANALKAAEVATAAAKEAEDALAGEREEWDGKYVKIDHPGAQAAIDLLAESNVDPKVANEIFAEALKTGDVTKVKWADLEKLIGPAKTTLVKSGVTQYNAEVVSKNLATVNAAYEIVGGEENWKAVRTWAQAQEKADKGFAALMPEYRNALELGGWAAKKAVEALKEAYNKAPNTKGLGVTKLVQGETVAAIGGETIGKAEYLKQMKALHESNAPSTTINALRLRRLQSRNAGIN